MNMGLVVCDLFILVLAEMGARRPFDCDTFREGHKWGRGGFNYSLMKPPVTASFT